MRKEAPLPNETPSTAKRLAFFSDNSQIHFNDILLNLTVINSKEASNEPRYMYQRRREIENACVVITDLSKAGIPAVISAPIYHALKAMGM